MTVLLYKQEEISKHLSMIMLGALVDLDQTNELAPNDNFTLKKRGDFKAMMNDYVGALVDLDQTNELASNDSFILKKEEISKQ